MLWGGTVTSELVFDNNNVYGYIPNAAKTRGVEQQSDSRIGL